MNNLEIVLPEISNSMDQNEEYFILKGDTEEKIQFHDYERIYQTPGLYEALFHHTLKCKSPTIIKEMLYENVEESSSTIDDLKILDFGAGNGLVAEALDEANPELIVGLDILQEAKMAAERDRGSVYEEYYVEDLTNPSESIMKELEAYHLNTIVSVAALGFDHIPPKSFINAFNLIENDGWIAINLRDKFLTKQDDSGFKKTLDWIADDYIDFVDEKTYVHRLSVSGKPIHYTAIVGKKLGEIVSPDQPKSMMSDMLS